MFVNTVMFMWWIFHQLNSVTVSSCLLMRFIRNKDLKTVHNVV